MNPLLCLVALAAAAPVLAQSNAIPGTDVNIYGLHTATFSGREGPAYPNGTAGLIIGHRMGNCGSVPIPWDGVAGSTMQDQSIMIAFMLTRVDAGDGRIVQVNRNSFCKHSRVAFNLGNSICGSCQNGSFGFFHVNCYDAYGTSFNGNQYNLGPTSEIDPWLGTWEPRGSYFDIGDPGQPGFPLPADSVQSMTTSGFGSVKNRMECPEQELIQPGSFFAQNQVVVKGEPLANRANNLVTRGMSISWNGTAWTHALTASEVQSTVLDRWPGASVAMAGNGSDDGRFAVAVKVTGPVNGLWHYEYAVHNIDNARGGGSLRIAMCPTARVENIGFRDPDQNGANDWSSSRTATSLEFTAPLDNPMNWNHIYNFWFDCDAAPGSGDVHIDAARLGAGAITVDIATTVPVLLGTEYLGDGCGAPTEPAIYANGAPSSPNPGYAIIAQLDPFAVGVLGFSSTDVNLPLGNGCTAYIDSQLLATAALFADGAGMAGFSLAIPPGLVPIDFTCQAFELVTGGPVLGFLEASNGLKIRAAGTGCP